MERTPAHPWACEPVPQLGSLSVSPSTSNSRLGRNEPGCARTGSTMEATVWVGIDVSKDRLDVHVLPEGRRSRWRATARAWPSLVERLAALSPELVAVEATGGFETVVAAALAGAGLPLVVVNPAQVRALRPGARQARQDRPDRRRDDRPLRRGDPARDPAACPIEATQLLADLVARRRQIIEMIVAEKNRQRRSAR